MILPRLLAFTSYWEGAPPLHESFAAFCVSWGILKSPPARAAADPETGTAVVEELLANGMAVIDGPSWAEQDAAYRAAQRETPTEAP